MEKYGHEWLIPVTAELVDHPLTVIGRGTCQSSKHFSLIKGAPIATDFILYSYSILHLHF